MTVGRKHYGKVAIDVLGREAWEKQDATKSWSDDGEVKKIIEESTASMVHALEAAVAQNAHLGVSEYLSIAEAAATVDEKGELLIGVRVSNDEASLIAYVPLKKLIMSVLTELRPRLGVDPQAQTILSHLVGLGRNLASLGVSQSKSQETQKAGTIQ